MGVPKFFRYISERYPCLSELIREYEIPEFDNLYLDMNGIIHMCSHPDDYDPHFRISEEKIFSDIFHYIEVLFRMIKPQKLFFMAVDGVAPRAKMNQQRGRRFRSAKEAEILEAKAKEKGEELPAEARFDSNCITPGTFFMARLHEQLKYFVSSKISKDYLWQKCKVILSGHETPGEGEHKIMDYIRYMKAQPGYDPNTRHCLYGLDADLIMLGLCSHEPHFSLLREEVRFGKKAKRKNIPEQMNFYLLHLSLMREYLELEFLPLKESLPFEYDMEKIIDDWVLMGFLVGNDFIPHLPNLHIANGALPILYNAYMKILPTLDGYINEFGNLNLERFEKFMSALAAIDKESFSEQFADLKYFQSKTGRRPNGKERTSYKLRELEEWVPDDFENGTCLEPDKKTTNKDLAKLIEATDSLFLGDNFLKSTETDDNKSTKKLKELSNYELLTVFTKSDDFLSSEPSETIKSDENSTNGTCSTNKNLLIDIFGNGEGKIEEAVEATEDLENKSKILEPSCANLADLALDDLEGHDDEDISPYYTESESEDEELMNAEFIQHKHDYYMNKLDYTQVTPEVMRDQAEGYVRAIQWNLHYYYNGVCSWSWYYPHHYAPYISDIKGFSDLKLEFDLGTPFKPFEQLLAVLPAASKTLLPEPYQELMTSENSSIIMYYPQEFRTDLNGKKQEWEAVVLIPFIDEDLLLKAMEPCNAKLTESECKRNSHGPMLVYQFTPEDCGPYKAPDYFPTIKSNHALLKELTIDDIRIPIEKLVKGPCPGSIHDVYYPGFPTMKHLKYSGHLEKAKVRVFDTPSQNESMIVSIKPVEKEIDIEEFARHILGKSVYVAWPHLTEAIVISVSDANCRYHKTNTPGKFTLEVNKDNLINLWQSQKMGIINFYKEKLGINVGETKILLHVKVLIGQKYTYSSDVIAILEKQWSSNESVYPIQAVVQDLIVAETSKKIYKTVQDLFPVNSTFFMLGCPHYGCKGSVLENVIKQGRIRVQVYTYPHLDLSFVHDEEQQVKYMTAGPTAQKLAITPHLLSRITGAIFVIPGVKGNSVPKNSSKINIGLNLKLNKKNEEIPGYTRKVDSIWLYSMKAVNLVRDYMSFCPELFSYVSTHLGNDIFYESEIFPNEIGEGRIQKIVDWMKSQAFYTIEKKKVGSKTVDVEIVKKIEQIVDEFNAQNFTPTPVIMQVKPYLLFKPEVQSGNIPPDITAIYQLYDRVVNIRDSYTVPYGCKGTIIGIQGNDGENDVIYDVVFDQEFVGGYSLNCSPNRGYKVPKTALINISHGMRLLEKKTVNPMANTWFNTKFHGQMNQQQQQQQQQQHPQQQYRPVQSQNSAFASWTPSPNQNYYQSQYYPPLPPQRVFLPPQLPLASRPGFMQQMKHHQRMPITPPTVQQVQRPPKAQNVNPDFMAFFQGMQQSSETRGKVANLTGPPLMQMSPSFNKQQADPRSPNRPVPVKQEDTDKTEILKKLLKIEASTDQSQISVQDLFDAARNKEQQQATQKNVQKFEGFSIKLMNYCQQQHMGVPRYNYFTSGLKTTAQVVLHDGRKVLGDEADTKEEAAENAAKKFLQQINMNKIPFKSSSEQSQSTNEIGDPKGFPVPPKQWYQNSKQSHKLSPKSPNAPTFSKQFTANHSVNGSEAIVTTSNYNSIPKTNTRSVSFVPLQAVKHRHKSNSNDFNNSTERKEKNIKTNTKNNNDESSSNTNDANSRKDNNQQSGSQTSSNSGQPKQKVRKCRIAANFSRAKN